MLRLFSCTANGRPVGKFIIYKLLLFDKLIICGIIFLILYRDMFLKHILLEIEIHGDGFLIA